MSFWINAAIWAIIIGVGMWKSKPKPLTAAFIVSVYVGLETYFYVSHWLSYLPTGLHILFYAIPVCVSCILVYLLQKDKNWLGRCYVSINLLVYMRYYCCVAVVPHCFHVL